MEHLSAKIQTAYTFLKKDRFVYNAVVNAIEQIEEEHLTIVNKRTDNPINIPTETEPRQKFFQLLETLFINNDMKHLMVV